MADTIIGPAQPAGSCAESTLGAIQADSFMKNCDSSSSKAGDKTRVQGATHWIQAMSVGSDDSDMSEASQPSSWIQAEPASAIANAANSQRWVLH
jgi:hypothetical protein